MAEKEEKKEEKAAPAAPPEPPKPAPVAELTKADKEQGERRWQEKVAEFVDDENKTVRAVLTLYWENF